MESFESTINTNEDHQITNTNSDHGWQKVTYAKRQRKQKPSDSAAAGNANKINEAIAVNEKSSIFRSLEQQSEDRRRRIIESQRAANASAVEAPVRSKHRSDDDDDDDDDSDDGAGAGSKGIEKVEEKKVKQKKPKKPKVTVAEAAAKIDAADLASFLVEILGSYEGQEIQLMRFADYFGRAFSAVSSAQFPWVKMFRETPLAKMTDMPLSHISVAVYKTSIDWISQRSIEALGTFVMWSLDCIFTDLASQQASSKVAKKVAQQVSHKSQVGVFVVLAMVLRRRPDSLVNVLPKLREGSKYQGQDKLAVIAWAIAQASQGDLAVGLYSWTHNLLPLLSGKGSNPQSRDLILQLVEKILSSPKARTILVSGAVRKGEQLVPPFALELLMRVTFPASSARVKATERFEAIYPTLKEVALAGSPGSKAMKQTALQIQSFALKAAGESNPQLSKEAAGICVWCLTRNAECYKHWDKVYQENLEASIAILKNLSEDWKELSEKLASLDLLRGTLKNLRQKNEKAIASGEDAKHHTLVKKADKYCKLVQGKSSRGHCCSKGLAFAVIGLAVGAAIVYPDIESWDLNKLAVFINSQFSH